MITPNRFLGRSAFVAMLSYVMVMLTCAYGQGTHLPHFGAETLGPAAVISETHGRDGEEELCEFMHEQLFVKQAFSAGSTTIANISSVLLIGKQILHPIADLNGFRPPGNWFAPLKNLSMRLYSVFRI